VANKPEAADAAAAPPKSKKKLFMIIGVVLVLALGGGGFFIMKQRAAAAAAAAEGDGAEAPVAHAAPAAHGAPKAPPVYLPLDNMVVNLADPGGERVAQVGITFEVIDSKASDSVKAYLPTIRSSVLMLLSQRTSEELLSPEGKQKLIEDILREASVPFGGDPDPVEATTPKKKAKKKVAVEYPVVGVLFSSLIVQ
jgi:flagellar FliL protein